MSKKKRSNLTSVPEVRAQSDKRVRKDPNYILSQKLRIKVRRALRENSTKLLKQFGYTVEELRSHLESLFESDMTWDNYGEWHIDHKEPCAKFNLQCMGQQRKCFHYSNLQPLWKRENILKGSVFEGKRHYYGK